MRVAKKTCKELQALSSGRATYVYSIPGTNHIKFRALALDLVPPSTHDSFPDYHLEGRLNYADGSIVKTENFSGDTQASHTNAEQRWVPLLVGIVKVVSITFLVLLLFVFGIASVFGGTTREWNKR